MGFHTIGPVVKNHISPKIARNSVLQYMELRTIRCPWSVDEFLFFIFTASSTSSSQDTVTSTENPAAERRKIMREESRGNPSRGAETENTNKNEEREELRGGILRDLPDWLQDFKENLVDKKNLRPHQYSPNSSHEFPMEPRARVVSGSGKHSVFSHFPKDLNCDFCLWTEIYKGFLQKTHQRNSWYSLAQSGHFR